MATDVDVQYFSHLNGLVLGNNWGDMIRLLDTCLVNGLPLTEITSASIDAQGDILITTYAAHKCMLFQIIELTGFTPTELNGKYRIKGTPSENQLVLKATHVGKSVATKGAAKLAPLGYDIIFRDTNDVKRVYRAKNPTTRHPFIRVDESISSDTGSYTSTYAKYAMVGLLERMTHIDDYENPEVLQLPFDPADPAKNWKITGTGTNVVRGWSKWYWARSRDAEAGSADNTPISNASRTFTVCGNADAFFHMTSLIGSDSIKALYGLGLYKSSSDSDIKPWFLMCPLSTWTASDSNNGFAGLNDGTYPLTYAVHKSARFIANKHTIDAVASHVSVTPILVDWVSGTAASKLNSAQLSALEIPFYDVGGYLRGTLPHVCYAGRVAVVPTVTTPTISGGSMYITDSLYSDGVPARGCVHFYLGELE